jgi:NAD(P)-dependent dehydrogenase (short-subunit alcohol dehydrogenase family)
VEALGTGATAMFGNVCDDDPVSAAVDKAASLGTLRVVVNCAGVGDPARTIERSGPLSMTRFRLVVEVNLCGNFNVTRLAAARMMQNSALDGERGVIVNTASVAAFDGQIGQAAYSASKGAIAAMTLPLARELAAYLIRVVAIAPAMLDTPMLQTLSDGARASIAAQVPYPARLGDPAEYASLVGHIMENPMINGEVVRIDGAVRPAAR